MWEHNWRSDCWKRRLVTTARTAGRIMVRRPTLSTSPTLDIGTLDTLEAYDALITGTNSAYPLTFSLPTTSFSPSLSHWLVIGVHGSLCGKTNASFTGLCTAFNLAAELHNNTCPSRKYIAASWPSLWLAIATPETLCSVHSNFWL